MILMIGFLFCFSTLNLSAAESPEDIVYLQIEPIIVTNYQKKKSKKPGFIQLSAQLTTRGKLSADTLTLHMPLIRDFIIEYLSFTPESIIKDVTKRRELRAALSKGLQAMLTKKVGTPLVEDIIITHYMWD